MNWFRWSTIYSYLARNLAWDPEHELSTTVLQTKKTDFHSFSHHKHRMYQIPLKLYEYLVQYDSLGFWLFCKGKYIENQKKITRRANMLRPWDFIVKKSTYIERFFFFFIFYRSIRYRFLKKWKNKKISWAEHICSSGDIFSFSIYFPL